MAKSKVTWLNLVVIRVMEQLKLLIYYCSFENDSRHGSVEKIGITMFCQMSKKHFTSSAMYVQCINTGDQGFGHSTG